MKTLTKVYLMILFLVFIGLNLSAQSVPEEVISRGDKKVNRIIKKGDYYYNQMDIKEALQFYNSALFYLPEDAILNFKIGICYLYEQMPDSALIFFDNAYNFDANVSEEIHFFKARSLQLNGNFEEAIKEFELHKATLTLGEEYLKKNTDKYIAECKMAMTTEIANKNVIIENLGDSINTEYPEYSPFISDNGKLLIFTARRPAIFENVNRENSDYSLCEDIYFSHKNQNYWTLGEKVGIKFNSHFNNASAGISPDGKMLFVYNNRRGGNIYFAEWQDTVWSDIKKIGKGINSKYHESSVSMTSDYKTLYFVSNRTNDNLGGNDIYYCTKDDNNKWSKPVNIGSVINTPSDEESVFISADGNMLYFSSRGHNSFGGYDIYTSTKDENQSWSTPVNMGMPINTVEDDVFFTIYDTIAYYSSISHGANRNFDIFKVTFIPEEVEIPVVDTIVEIVEVVEIDTVPEEIVEIVEVIEPPKEQVKREIPMYGSIHFDFDKSDLKVQSNEMLDQIAMYMIENLDTKIIISGHTDYCGSVEYNQILSENRAKAAYNYLVAKTVDKSRISFNGFSELQPIDTNETVDGRANNRRVDFEIIIEE